MFVGVANLTLIKITKEHVPKHYLMLRWMQLMNYLGIYNSS